ncbi:hypothetical protein ACNVD5_07230, partial [Klebsiella pneumoniae]
MKTVKSVLTAQFFVLSAFIWLASPACADSGSRSPGRDTGSAPTATAATC